MMSRNFRKSAELFCTIFGGLLISLPAIPQVVAQESTPKINPCPSIFYEEPHNNRVAVPQGCPPNARTQRETAQGVLTIPATPSQDQTTSGTSGEAPLTPSTSTTEPPLLDQQQAPIATITLNNGKVDIRFVNDTAANITYQVIGDTAPRSLQGKSDITLQGLNAPVTVTFQREDGGQLTVTLQPPSEPGNLEVTFNEGTDAIQGRSVVRIEQNGSVFLN